MPLNIIYTNNGSNGTPGQTVAGLNQVNAYFVTVPNASLKAPTNNSDAASVIQSNGDNIGNAKPKSNPLPPGLTA